jgi:hypothetical protein
MWFEAMVYRRADAVAVNAIASGSQHKTISATSHRIARSLSVPVPISSATQSEQWRLAAATPLAASPQLAPKCMRRYRQSASS